MTSENMETIKNLIICFSCIGLFVVIVSTVIWLNARRLSGQKEIIPKSNFKELMNVGKGTVSGVLGGITGGAIYSGGFAASVFPNEKISLMQGVIVWVMIGAVLGMVGGGLGGFVSDKKLRPIIGGMNWVAIGALLGPVILGLGGIIGISIGGLSVGVGGSPLIIIVGGAFVGALIGAGIQSKKGLLH